MVKALKAFGLALVFIFCSALLGVSMGAGAGVLTATEAYASFCEHDQCMRVCVGESCGGSCFDAPGSDRGCAMSGEDCFGYSCGPGQEW
jgi:hypothetical protein